MTSLRSVYDRGSGAPHPAHGANLPRFATVTKIECFEWGAPRYVYIRLDGDPEHMITWLPAAWFRHNFDEMPTAGDRILTQYQWSTSSGLIYPICPASMAADLLAAAKIEGVI